jgi:hypothetical protein
VIIAASALTPLALSAPETTQSATTPEIKPSHVVHVPHTLAVDPLAFSPDGTEVYCEAYRNTVDVGAVLLEVWREGVGAALATAGIVVAIFVLRAVRRPQTPGDPYCRRCNYNVSGQVNPDTRPSAGDSAAPETPHNNRCARPPAGTRCPECGLDLADRPPRAGRSLARRVVPPLGVLALATAVYALALTLEPSRRPTPGLSQPMPRLRSDLLSRLAESNSIPWLLKHRTDWRRIVRVDASRGVILGEFDVCGPRAFHLRTSPDSAHLAICVTSEGCRWVRSDGTPVARASFAGLGINAGASTELLGVVGAPDQPTRHWVFVRGQAAGDPVDVVVAWCPETGDSERVLTGRPAPIVLINGTPVGPFEDLGRRVTFLPLRTGPALAIRNDFLGSHADTLLLRTKADGAWSSRALSPHVGWITQIAGVTPDGRRVIYEDSKDVYTIDPATGERDRVGRRPLNATSLEAPELFAHGRLFLREPSYATGLAAPWLHDMRTGRALGVFSSAGTGRVGVVASRDGRRLAIGDLARVAPGGCRLMVYELPE